MGPGLRKNQPGAQNSCFSAVNRDFPVLGGFLRKKCGDLKVAFRKAASDEPGIGANGNGGSELWPVQGSGGPEGGSGRSGRKKVKKSQNLSFSR